MSYVTTKQLSDALAPLKADVSTLKLATVSLANTDTALAGRIAALEADVAAIEDTAAPTGTTAPTEPTEPTGSGGTGTSILKVDFAGKTLAQVLALPGIETYDTTYNGRSLLEMASVGTRPTLKLILPAGTNLMPHIFQNFAARKNYRFRAIARMQPGFTTDGKSSSVAAKALKVLGPGWDTADGRGTLDLTNTNQYQVSLDAKDRVTGFYFMPGKNSGDAGQPWGGQVFAVRNEWSDGLFYVYEIEEMWLDSATVRLDAWIYPEGGARPSAPNITITNKATDRPAPMANKMEIFFHYNQTRSFETYIDLAGWELIA